MKETILFIPGLIAPHKFLNWKYFNNSKLYQNRKYHIAPIDHWGTFDKRSQQINHYIINHLKDQKFHVVSHSKGGLDFLYLLSKNNLLEKNILSHTSISCPYGGSIIALIVSRLIFLFRFIPRVNEIYLTLKEIKKPFLEARDFSFKQYCIQAEIKSFSKTYPLFWITYILCYLFEGQNDGFVSLNSSKKGILLEKYPCDHIELIGNFYTERRKKTFSNILELIENKIC